MRLLGCLVDFVLMLLVLSEDCDKLGILLYEDLGCTPEYGKQNTCPIKYSCSGLEPSNETCYFQSKSYKEGEAIEDSLTSPTCNKNCYCSSREGRASFKCASVECPESLGTPTRPECYRKFSLDECCSIEQECQSPTEIEKCRINGTEYKEGEQFFPENTCLICLCQKGFDGKFEQPSCKRRSCGMQLQEEAGRNLQNACAPLYGRRTEHVRCCPSSWICPDGSENIKGLAKSDDVCKFGDKTLNIGQNFEKFNVENSFGRNITKVICECVIPPLLTCNENSVENF